MSTVKIYCYNCDELLDRELFERCYVNATKERKVKIDRLRFDSDKRLSLGADILLKRALGKWANEPMKTNEFGKPYIERCPLKFSISHSGSIALLATADCEVGCDVQIMKEQPRGVAERYFCESERRFIEESDDKARAFFRLWTAKESYIKMLGKGLSVPLDSFEVQFKNGAPFISADCTLTELDIAPNYSAAVCANGSPTIEYIK